MTVKIPKLFRPAARYPADPRAVFILALSVFTSLTAVALQKGPPSLAGLLPTWVVLGWGILLGIGSAVTLAGMYFQSVNGIITEQVGSVTVAAATVFYSGIAFWQVGLDALQSVGLILAWGLSCALRWFQLQALINDAVGRQAKMEMLAELDRKISERAAREIDNKRFHADHDDHLGRWGAP